MSEYEGGHVKSANVNILIQMAEEVGKNLLKDFKDIGQLQGSPNLKNFITNGYNYNKENLLTYFTQSRPRYGFIFDDGTSINGEDSSHRFLIKMIDGIENFSNGYPFYTFMIAIEENRKVIDAVIFDPLHGDMFYAQENKGAFILNDGFDKRHSRMRVGKTREVERSLFGSYIEDEKRIVSEVIPLSKKSTGVRSSGCASLDIAFVCCGRLDGFWQDKPDYITAKVAEFFAKETAGVVTDYDKNQEIDCSNGIIVSNLILNKQLVDFFHK